MNLATAPNIAQVILLMYFFMFQSTKKFKETEKHFLNLERLQKLSSARPARPLLLPTQNENNAVNACRFQWADVATLQSSFSRRAAVAA